MMKRLGKTCTVLALALIVLTAGAMAAEPIKTIAPGNVVFLGEEGLDITAAMEGDSQIGWWASAANIAGTSPDSGVISVPNPSSFFISPTDFASKTGVWYHLNPAGKANGSVFTVVDPNLDIRVYDATVGVDATANGWITTGDEVEFRISTNLYQMSQRGIPGAPITIKVQSPDGALFSALINSAGTATNIVDIPVGSSPYSTGAIWDTGRHDTYGYGTYAIWAECNANSMKDNYDYSGKTYTERWGLLDQERNPLIGGSVVTASPTTATTAVTTTVKATTPTTTMEPTTVTTPVTELTTPPTITATPPPTVPSTAAPTKTPGFEAVLAGAAFILALAWTIREN